MVTVITPTADQPTGIALLECYMARQTVQPDQWLVADDGNVPAMLTMGQEHIVRTRTAEGGASLAGNMLAALELVRGDVVIVAEHDDWYRADHIETCLRELEGYAATGSVWQRYYNVSQRCWRVMRNVGSALCNTAFTAELVPNMRASCERAREQNKIGVDRYFWESICDPQKNITETDTVVGIKGLPGRVGLGLGHKPDLCATHDWTPDPNGDKAVEWLGDDAARYAGACCWG